MSTRAKLIAAAGGFALAIVQGTHASADGRVRFDIESFPTGICPATIDAADMDADGHLDLVVACHHSYDIRVYLGYGDATFTPLEPVFVEGTEDSHVLSLAIADYDGDGHLDVASSSHTNGELYVLSGDGTGVLSNLRRHPIGNFALRTVTADFNGDGNPDLAGPVRNDDDVAILLGDGEGGFALPASIEVGDGPTGLAARDIDRDGNVDLAVANAYSESATLLWGRGDGSFARDDIAGFENVHFVLPHDFDGDGILDLAVAHGDALTIVAALSDRKFKRRDDYELASHALTVVAIDLDEDGNVDLVAGNWRDESVSVLRGDGEGCFAAPESFPHEKGPWGIAVGDFDEDGRDDFASTAELENTVVVYLNRSHLDDAALRGDANRDEAINISDVLAVLNWLFGAGAELSCRGAADSNSDGDVNIADALRLLGFLFGEGETPKPTVAECASAS